MAAQNDTSMAGWGYTGWQGLLRPVNGAYTASMGNLTWSPWQGYSLVRVRKPSSKIAFMDGCDSQTNVWGSNPTGASGYWTLGEKVGSGGVAYRHNGQQTANGVFFDGHAQNRNFIRKTEKRGGRIFLPPCYLCNTFILKNVCSAASKAFRA